MLLCLTTPSLLQRTKDTVRTLREHEPIQSVVNSTGVSTRTHTQV